MIDNLKTKIEQDKNINEIEISILGCYLPLNVSKIITHKLVNYSSKNKSFNDLTVSYTHLPLPTIYSV